MSYFVRPQRFSSPVSVSDGKLTPRWCNLVPSLRHVKSGVKCAAYLTRHKNRIKASSERTPGSHPLFLLLPNWLSHGNLLATRSSTLVYRYTYEYYYCGAVCEGRDLTRDILSSHLDATPFLSSIYLSLSLSYSLLLSTKLRKRETRIGYFSITSLFRFIFVLLIHSHSQAGSSNYAYAYPHCIERSI